MGVGEVAAPATRNEYLLSRPLGMFQYGDAPAALARFDGAHQPSGSGTENQGIVFVGGHLSEFICEKNYSLFPPSVGLVAGLISLTEPLSRLETRGCQRGARSKSDWVKRCGLPPLSQEMRQERGTPGWMIPASSKSIQNLCFTPRPVDSRRSAIPRRSIGLRSGSRCPRRWWGSLRGNICGCFRSRWFRLPEALRKDLRRGW